MSTLLPKIGTNKLVPIHLVYQRNIPRHRQRVDQPVVIGRMVESASLAQDAPDTRGKHMLTGRGATERREGKGARDIALVVVSVDAGC